MFKLVYWILFCCLLQSCEFLEGDGGTTTGNPQVVQVNMSAYDPGALTVIETMTVNSLYFCFKRIRFKPLDSSVGDNIDFELGERAINSEGTDLGNVTVSSGTYKRVEIDLERDCDGTVKNSVSLDNDNGTFTSTDRITIKFDGNFNTGTGTLNLGIQTIISTLNSYNGTPSLKVVLEGLSGTID